LLHKHFAYIKGWLILQASFLHVWSRPAMISGDSFSSPPKAHLLKMWTLGCPSAKAH